MGLNNCTSRYLSKENKNTNLKRYIHSHVHCCCCWQHDLNSQEMETTKVSMNRWIDVEVVHTHTHTHTLEYYSAIKLMKSCHLWQFGQTFSSVEFSLVAQSYLTYCDPMDCSMPGFPVHDQFSEVTQTHVHWVGDAIQPSHPLSSLSPPAFNLSQHQGLFKWVSSSHQVDKVLEFHLQYQSFQWIFRTGLISLQSKGLSSLLQHPSSKASVLQHSAFFIV